jgi:hypothetical protein
MGFALGPRLYNLFPRLVGSFDGWAYHYDRVKAMGFDWVYVNPFHFAGYSGSLYAVKDYYAYHPLFIDDNLPYSHQEQFQRVLDAAHANGLRFMMDLVINHTAFDSVMATEHPDWFMKTEDGSLKHPGCMDGETWVEWGDLVQVDNADSPEREGLWRYWLGMMRHYLAMGVDGFRCDAAYHVPTELWKFLIPAIKQEYPATQFFGETLGCKPYELLEVATSGFDYVFNSVRWWNYEDPWFLEAHARTLGAAPAIGFPESHDTERAAAEPNANEAALKQKYTFAALMATGVMMPIGYEYGFKKRLDVVTTFPDQWEEPSLQLGPYIGRVNALKGSARVFNEEGVLIPVATHSDRVKAYAKGTLDAREKALFVMNLDHENWQEFSIPSVADAVGTRYLRDVSIENRWESIGEDLTGRIAPGACQVFLGELTPHLSQGPGESQLGHRHSTPHA